jgi:hypothetical protein
VGDIFITFLMIEIKPRGVLRFEKISRSLVGYSSMTCVIVNEVD